MNLRPKSQLTPNAPPGCIKPAYWRHGTDVSPEENAGGQDARPTASSRGTIPRSRRERGSAIFIVLILLTLMLAMSISNARVLKNLRDEIQLTNRLQLRKYHSPAPALSATNAPVKVSPTNTLPPAASAKERP